MGVDWIPRGDCPVPAALQLPVDWSGPVCVCKPHLVVANNLVVCAHSYLASSIPEDPKGQVLGLHLQLHHLWSFMDSSSRGSCS